MSQSRLGEDAVASQDQVGTRVPLAIVQHGHQYLITDGYDNREGITEVLEAFASVFALHLKYRVPLNLHLSGTLIEAIAWHSPDFFDWVKVLRQHGLLEMVGSAYSQNIMTLFSFEHNLRQLNETLLLYRRHLGVEPREVKAFWLPERVWNTEKLAPILRSPHLLNGGYHCVLFDDRLTYSLNGNYKSSKRREFDLNMAPSLYQSGENPRWDATPIPGDGHHGFHPCRIEGGRGLVGLPISSDLRYCIPPRHSDHWAGIEHVLCLTAAAGDGAVALYGDDLEKTATLGPWTSGHWKREGVTPYEQLLEWIDERPTVEPVLISSWLADHPPQSSRAVDPGTFFELAYPMRAGEDYMSWWQGRKWAPYRRQLADAESLLRRAAPRCQSGLWELAWKQLMACSCETAWHTVEKDDRCRPAAWAKAAASHVKSVFVIAAAAEWQEQRDGRSHVERVDIDRDRKEEVILKNDCVYAVFSPHYGGRLIYLFDLTQDWGRLVIGNPADDWNWQEELNRFMEVPRNHPGAFADVGHENDSYKVRDLKSDAEGAEFTLVNREDASPLARSVKCFRLGAHSPYIEASYRLAEEPERISLEFCLSPDYLALLRGGKWGIRPITFRSARGWRNWPTAVWVHIPSDEPVIWDAPARPECGHGMILRVTAYRPAFRLLLGVGAPPTSDASSSEGIERLSAGPGQ